MRATQVFIDTGIDGGVYIEDYTTLSIAEDATPIDASSAFGGVGTVSITTHDFEGSRQIINKNFDLDGGNGKMSGVVRGVSKSGGMLSITADSVLSKFNVEKTIPPYHGTLLGAIEFYCDQVGITNAVSVDSSFSSRAVNYPGWNGNVWANIKFMLAKERVELALVYDKINVRPIRQSIADISRSIDSSWTMDASGTASYMEVFYYNYAYGLQAEIYPPTNTEEPTVFQVGAGETVTFQVELTASVISVNQPQAVDWVEDRPYPNTTGVYSVAGNDGLPIPAAQWLGQGGSVTVQTTDDPSVISVTVVGASESQYAPYRIAMTSGASGYYNSLHVTGEALVSDRRSIVVPTGIDGSGDTQTIDNIFVSTLGDAYNAALSAGQQYGGVSYTVSGTASGINKADGSMSLVAATIEDFNVANAGTTIADFNVTWTGDTIADFTQYWESTVASLYVNQLYGNVVGSRVLLDDANFRVESVTNHEQQTDFVARLDTTIEDFNNHWVGTDVVRTNMVINPTFTSVVTGWSRAATGTWAASGGRGVFTAGTGYAAGSLLVYESLSHPYVLGTPVSARMKIAHSRATATSFRLALLAYNSVGGGLSGTQLGPTVSIPAGQTGEVFLFGAVLPNTSTASYRLAVYDVTGLAVGDIVYIDDVLVEQGVTTPGAYLDGDTVDTPGYFYDWTGTPNNSTSTETYAPKSISAFNDALAGHTCLNFSLEPLWS